MSRLVGNVKECTIALSFSDTGVAILKKQFYKNLTKYLVVYFVSHVTDEGWERRGGKGEGGCGEIFL